MTKWNSMKVCTLIHNPGAGAEKYNKDELISQIESLGYECRYISIKKTEWKDLDPDTDFLVIAGGDGTVRKVTKRLLNRKILRKRFPIALLPLGTANNISKTLNIEGEPEEIAQTWSQRNLKKIDIGFIDGLEEPNFFLEGFGQGIFPILMQKMKDSDGKAFSNLKEEIKYSLKVLQDTVRTYKPEELQLQINGQDHSGRYLLAEIMNIRSIGPNLMLAPDADPGDGELEVVLVAESQRVEFAKYVENKLNGMENPFVFNSIKAKSIRMHCRNTHIHIDDELIMIDDQLEINIEVFEGLLKFFAGPKV
jgi:diacylglycerol kinase family enzyme